MENVNKMLEVLQEKGALEIMLFLAEKENILGASIEHICKVCKLEQKKAEELLKQLRELGLVQNAFFHKDIFRLTKQGALILIALDFMKAKLAIEGKQNEQRRS